MDSSSTKMPPMGTTMEETLDLLKRYGLDRIEFDPMFLPCLMRFPADVQEQTAADYVAWKKEQPAPDAKPNIDNARPYEG